MLTKRNLLIALTALSLVLGVVTLLSANTAIAARPDDHPAPPSQSPIGGFDLADPDAIDVAKSCTWTCPNGTTGCSNATTKAQCKADCEADCGVRCVEALPGQLFQ